jgi:hypothetical protein
MKKAWDELILVFEGGEREGEEFKVRERLRER